ncbi:hypothetical protein C8R44DRAFT_869401 [Mycena epipterygia]|nr:hypothetical protein C8R44DRAFT_869401 [Mycena epipterygia]
MALCQNLMRKRRHDFRRSQPSPLHSSDPAVSVPPSASSPLAGWERVSDNAGDIDCDKISTNLCIEGLPLTINKPTFAALVSPHPIKRSRFSKNKFSSPPRITAFVQLETRAAADGIIECLDGTMVRGWNDPGGIISVRFVDTREQWWWDKLGIDDSEQYSQFEWNDYPKSDLEVDYSRVSARYPLAQPLAQQTLPTARILLRHPSSTLSKPAAETTSMRSPPWAF